MRANKVCCIVLYIIILLEIVCYAIEEKSHWNHQTITSYLRLISAVSLCKYTIEFPVHKNNPFNPEIDLGTVYLLNLKLTFKHYNLIY